MSQVVMQLNVAVSKVVNGVEMGVFDDGTGYLTESSLAAFCGVARNAIAVHAQKWADDPKTSALADILEKAKYADKNLFVDIHVEGKPAKAYPDTVCVALLEYYAFDAGRYCNDHARVNYRKLGHAKLRELIHEQTGYAGLVDQSWKNFHDRLMLNSAPMEYFSVFREIAFVAVQLIRAGLQFDHRTIPDGSVGIAWAKYWNKERLAKDFGERIRYPHVFPKDYPQSKAAEIYAYVYPLAALGEFRRWLDAFYFPDNFPKYLKTKVRSGAITAGAIQPLVAALQPPPAPPRPPALAAGDDDDEEEHEDDDL